MTDVAGSEVNEGRAAAAPDESAESRSPLATTLSIDIYLLRIGEHRSVLFVTRRSLASYAASEKDRFLRFIRRMMRSRNRLVRWVGRVTRAGHRYYQRLEDRIDPIERMVKALNYPGRLCVWHAPREGVRQEFFDCLRGQIIKHATWAVLDGIVTVVAVALTPFLVPIPGPNVFFFYPFLRLLSHLQALRGLRRAMTDNALCFSELADLAQAEEAALRSRARALDPEPVEGLNAFLERVGKPA